MTDDFENAIEWLESQDMAAVTLHNQKLKKRILQLAKRHPDEVAIIARPNDRGQHGYLFAHVPVDWLKVIPPRQVTEKMRKAGKAMSGNLKRTGFDPGLEDPNPRDKTEKV